MRALAKRTEASSRHRYLRPGALARLRDSRISARSHKLSDSLTRLTVAPGQPQVAAAALDLVPQFIGYSFGPRLLRRKRLVAARSINLPSLEPPPSGSSINMFGGDGAAAHWLKSSLVNTSDDFVPFHCRSSCLGFFPNCKVRMNKVQCVTDTPIINQCFCSPSPSGWFCSLFF